MFEILYWEMFLTISVLWVLYRVIVGVKEKKFSILTELKMLLVYICLVVIARFIYFPLHKVDGKVAPLPFDASKLSPLWINLVPVVHLFDVYDGWLVNIIGNILMFVPVGIVWPICFPKLNSVWKTTLAGAGYTLLIEISQIPFYNRCSDVDDLLLNTLGAFMGALIVFGIRKLKK